MSERKRVSLNGDWKFVKDDVNGAEAVSFNDEAWRTVQVPHDWSVEESFSKEWEGATGYLPGGIGWYRKTFQSLETDVTYLHFDGVYNNATIYLNGEKLGEHPYGYSPFQYDISGAVKEGENVIAVRVDRSRYCDSRWYTGSGIYRSVELVGASKTHIPVWGTFVTTPEVSGDKATVRVQIEVNCSEGAEVSTTIISPSGQKVAEGKCKALPVSSIECQVSNPQLWDLDTPNLYKAVTQISKDGEIVDEYETVFGIRTIKFDTDKGFFLNGENMKIKGVCLHHDGGCVGAAVPKDVWRRRFATLKAGGCNAIRIAHNPGSDEFLDLCDEMGILVQDEFFDEWDNPKDKRLNQNEQHDDYISRGYTEHFQRWAEEDLKAVMQSHRNHPSIFQWSIGNEIEWTYPRNAEATGFFNMGWEGNYFWEQPPNSIEEIQRLLKELPRGEYDIGETAQKLAKWTREMDTSRPVIANCILPSSSYESGYADALDIIGFSYRRVIYDYAHENYPTLPLMGTENLGQWHDWKAIQERDFVPGTFLWTGIDYMGEVNGQWPKNTLDSGLLDRAGFEKGSFHMMKTLWCDEPHVHLTSQILEKSPYIFNEETGIIGEEDPKAWETKTWVWHDVNTHWNYTDGEMVAVEVYSNCESVELFLNGESLGEKKLADFDDHIYKWAVPYAAGKLEAKGLGGTRRFSSARPSSLSADAEDDCDRRSNLVPPADVLMTAGVPASIQLTEDGMHVVAQLVDEAGVPVKSADQVIEFDVDGGKLLGVDNGSPFNIQDYQAKTIKTTQGRCLLVVEGACKVKASSEGLPSAELILEGS